ncbi:Antiviral helicase SKI2, partial [Bienertia sinuspersici]
MGLDLKKYETVASSLLMLDPLPTLSYAHGKVLSAERHQTVTEAPESRSDTDTRGAGGSGDSRLCSHCGRKGHEKEKCFELIGWLEWVGTAGRGGRSGGRSSSRGGRAGGRGGGHGRGGFAAAVDSSRQVGVSNSEVDHNTLPTLTDAQ